MANYQLLGNDISITPERAQYNEIRGKFLALATEAQEQYIDAYHSNIDSSDTLSETGKELGDTILDEYAGKAAGMLVQNGIYDMDDIRIREITFQNGSHYEKAFQDVAGDIASFENEIEQIEREHQEQIDDAGNSWVGGGFGLVGAIEGALEAKALNMASSAVVSLATTGSKNRTVAELEEIKNQIYKLDQIPEDLSKAIFEDVFAMHHVVVSELNARTDKTYEVVESSVISQANAIFRNIEKGNITGEEEKQMMAKLVEMNPYNEDYYAEMLLKQESSADEIEAIMKLFFINRNCAYDKFFSRKYPADTCTSLEDVTAKMENLKADMEKYHIPKCSHLDALQKVMDTFTLSLRTYEGVEYPTIELKQEAEQQDNELSKEFAAIASGGSLEQYTVFSTKLLSGSYSEYICNKYLEKAFSQLEGCINACDIGQMELLTAKRNELSTFPKAANVVALMDKKLNSLQKAEKRSAYTQEIKNVFNKGKLKDAFNKAKDTASGVKDASSGLFKGRGKRE